MGFQRKWLRRWRLTHKNSFNYHLRKRKLMLSCQMILKAMGKPFFSLKTKSSTGETGSCSLFNPSPKEIWDFGPLIQLLSGKISISICLSFMTVVHLAISDAQTTSSLILHSILFFFSSCEKYMIRYSYC